MNKLRAPRQGERMRTLAVAAQASAKASASTTLTSWALAVLPVTSYLAYNSLEHQHMEGLADTDYHAECRFESRLRFAANFLIWLTEPRCSIVSQFYWPNKWLDDII
jgi:hypothetical protein